MLLNYSRVKYNCFHTIKTKVLYVRMTKGLRNYKGCVNMKKKMSLREKREAEKQAKKAAYSSASKNTDSKPKVEKAEAVKEITVTSDTSKKKTSVKAAGLKSIIIEGKKMYMTSFGKGNAAVIEQKIDKSNQSIDDMNDSPSLKVTNFPKHDITFFSSRPFVQDSELTIYNPLYDEKDDADRKSRRIYKELA